MLRFPPKRFLFILIPCILIISAMIPIATFAASTKHQAAAVATETFSTVTVTNRCVTPPAATAPEGPQAIVTLNKGQEIEGSAVMTGNDVNHEEEALTVYELNGPAAILVKANFPARNFEFTAHTNNIQVVVCFAQIADDDDGDFNVPQNIFLLDHTASVKFEVEQAGTIDTETSSGI